MNPIQVLIADDHQLVAESLSILLGTIPEIEVIGIVNNGWQAIAYAEKYHVDFILADIHMPLLGGIDMTFRLKEKFPGIKILMLTMSEESSHIKEALQAGVDGYLMKKADRPELTRAIRAVVKGEKYFSHDVVLKLSQEPNPDNPDGKSSIHDARLLTRREMEIIRLILKEHSNIEIAEKLFIHPTTVETHRRNIYKKIDVTSALGLMRWALRHGLVEE